MSDVQEPVQPDTTNQVTVEDLQRMLDDMKSERETLLRERDTERTARIQTQQERDAERTARLITEKERDTNADRVVSEAEQRYNAQKDAVKNGIAAQKERVAMAEDAYARHAEAGDWKAAATAQRQMAEAAAKLTNLETQHEYLETNKERLVPPAQKPEPREIRVPPQAPTDRLSELVKDAMPSERAWIEKHPKFFDDANYRDQVYAASNLASKRYVRGTDDYIREIGRIMGDTEDAPRREAPLPRQERAPSADIAPQRRSAPGNAPQGGGQEFRLTADEAEVADGLYGNPNADGYIADPGERYRHYHTMKELQRSRGRLS